MSLADPALAQEQLDFPEQVGDAGKTPLKRTQPWLWLILISYLLVTIGYGVINPVFESPDEHLHFYTIQHIIDHGQLPTVAVEREIDDWVRQEAAQPPLYYLLGSALAAPLDSTDANDRPIFNKYSAVGNASSLNNINRFIHGRAESFPWQGYALQVHVLRFFSALLGLGTLLFIYGSGRYLWPSDPYRALLATALAAFLPQFNFLFSSVSNDTLIIFLVSAAIWQLIRLWLSGATVGRLLLLGITIGLAALSKNAGISLIIYAVGVLILMALRGESNQTASQSAGEGDSKEQGSVLTGWRLIWAAVVTVILPVVLIAGWLWIRNWQLYGDFTAANQFIRLAGGDRNYSLIQVLSESGGLWLSLFAVFGWFNLRPPEWVYWFWSGVVILALVGALWRGLYKVRHRAPRIDRKNDSQTIQRRVVRLLQQKWVLSLLLAGWVLVVYASLALFMMQTEAAQGRLLFPALIPLALGLAYGLTGSRILRSFSVILPPAALFISVYCLFFIIRPAYARPAVIEKLPESATSIHQEIGRGLTLIGSEVETKMAQPGEPVWVTLYWQRDAEIEESPAFTLTVFGRDFSEIAKIHSYHGRGQYPAAQWEPGVIIADQFSVRLDAEVEAPVLGKIWTSVEDVDKGVEVGQVKIVPENWPEATGQSLAAIGNTISLASTELSPTPAKPGDVLKIDLVWQVLNVPGRDLTTLVHIGQPDQLPLAVGDRPALNGDYPTSVWQAGEVIEDSYTIQIPADIAPGRHPVWVGLYDSGSLERLPLLVEEARQPGDVYLAGWLDIEE